MTSAPAGTLVGIVGYTPVLDAYPLGPRLMSRLEQALGDEPGVWIENLSWSPIHIVQQFQDVGARRPAGLVLVGASPQSLQPGRVAAYRWTGGRQTAAALQARIHEAVTGTVDIENTLMIGEHFGIWPGDCRVVEADIPADAFGRIVMADASGRGDDDALTEELGFSPRTVLDALVDMTVALVRADGDAMRHLPERCADDLVPSDGFLHNHVVGTADRSRATIAREHDDE